MEQSSEPNEPRGLRVWVRRFLAGFPFYRKLVLADEPQCASQASLTDGSSASLSSTAAIKNDQSSTSSDELTSDGASKPSAELPLQQDGKPADGAEQETLPDDGVDKGSTQAPPVVAGIRRLAPAIARIKRSARLAREKTGTLFALAIILLILELASIPSIPDARPGLLAAASFVIVILATPVVHHQRIQALRQLAIPLAVASGVLTIARWPAFFPRTPAALAIQALAIVGLVWILAKLLLLQRFGTRYCCRVSFADEDDELNRLFPFQRSYLEELRKAIIARPADQGARVVQLEGDLGQGKSFIIERLGLFLQHAEGVENGKDQPGKGGKNEFAVVVINVWEQESEPDLHLAIVEQILSHEKYWYPYGWLYYPLSLFVARVAKEWRFALSAGKAATKAEVQIPLTLPRPTGRRYLEQQVARVQNRRPGLRTIIVLDEIDRATPRVAQCAMTFARRSLDLPSVVVVLSYVDPIIRYKVFNPLVKSLPDLSSTMHAIIFDRGPENTINDPDLSRGSDTMPGGPYTEKHPASLRGWEAWQSAVEARMSGATDNTATGDRAQNSGDVKLDAKDSDDCRLSATLQLAFANAQGSERRRLQKKFSEKYIGTNRVQIWPLGLEDVALVAVRLDTVRNRVLALLGAVDSADFGKDAEQRLVLTITSALERANHGPHRPPTLRVLEGALLLYLSSVEAEIEPTGARVRFSGDFIAAIVVTAYHAAVKSMR